MRLNERIERVVRKVLDEEYGISREVENAVEDIISMLANMKDGDLITLSTNEHRHCPYKFGGIDYTFINNETVRVNAKFYDFPDENAMAEFKKAFPKEYSGMMTSKANHSTFDGKYKINVCVIRVDGKVLPLSYGNIQHELTHVFQRIMSGKRDGLVKNYDKYKHNINVLKSTTDKYLKKAALIMYYGYSYERDAFVNQLDGELNAILSNTDDDLDTAIKSTHFYRLFNKMKMHVDTFRNLKGEKRDAVETALRQEFNCGVDAIIRLGEKTLREYGRGLGMVKMKYLNYLEE